MAQRRAKNVVAATASGDVTTEMILGYIALLSIPNKPIPVTKLRRLWLAEGLDEDLVPKNRRAADVFMAACRSVESRRTEEDRTHEIKVDRVLESSEECVYQITQLVRDKDQRLIEHPKAMRITFTAKDGKIKHEALDDKQLYKELRRLGDVIRAEFDANGTKVPGNKIRAAIRETLLAEHSTRIQNKGVFFVPKVARNTLDSIEHIMGGLYGASDSAELAIIPLTGDTPEKEMVKRHFEESVTDEIDTLLAECSARLKSDNVPRGDRQKSLVAQRLKITEGVTRYEDLLDDKLGLLKEKMRLLDDSLEQLLMPR